MIRFFFLGLVIWLPLYSAASWSISEEVEQIGEKCSELSEASDISDCLNSETQRVMEGPVQDYFEAQLSQFLVDNGLESFSMESLPSLYQMFPVRVPTQNSFGEPTSCVDYTNVVYMVSEDRVRETARVLWLN